VSERRRIWLIYALGVALVLGALAWASASVYRLERRHDENLAMAQRRQSVRLALWRMDARLAPLLAVEASSPPGAPGAGALPRLGTFVIDAGGMVSGSDALAETLARRVRAGATRGHATGGAAGADDEYAVR